MAAINSVSVRNIVFYVVQGEHFANATVTFRKSDFSGPHVIVEVISSVSISTALSDLHAELVRKARAQLAAVVAVNDDQISKFVEEGLRGEEDYEYS